MDDRYFLMMALNNAWANRTFYAALEGLAPGAFTAPRPGFFPSLCETLNHIYEVDLYYIDAVTQGGRGRSVFDRTPVSDPAELGALQAGADMALASFCGALTPGALQATVPTERGTGTRMERVDALLLHLCQHQVHHRGQAHVQLQDAGIAPPQLDDFYLEYERAASARPYHGQS